MTVEEALASALQCYAGGRLEEAEAICRQILKTEPRHAAALHLSGVIAHQGGRHDTAIALIRQAIVADGRVPEYHSNLGVYLTRAGLFADAAEECSIAVALNPKLSSGHYNLGIALKEAGQTSEAEAAYRRALAINPQYAQAHNNLGNVLKELGQHEQAMDSYQQALAVRPDYAEAWSNLAQTLKDLGRLDEALDAQRRALALAPGDPDVHSNLLLSLHYDAGCDAQAMLGECRKWEERHGAPLRRFIEPHANDRAPERALRVGYVSPDLRMHSVAFFLLPLLEAHDRQAFPVTCYSTGAKADAVTERLRAASDGWCSLGGVSDEAAARRIRDDRIDILVDLSGHTSNNRLLLFARKPAPVQVTYLGFPGTTGVSAIDYRLTDALADPPGAERDCTERLVRLPESAWCFAPLSGSPPLSPLPALRNGYPTFGSFNNPAKLTPQTLTLWARILQQLPAAKLLLKSASFRSPQTVARLHRFFEAHAIASQRLELLPDEPSIQRHLQCYERVDIALDSFPYHGTTTTCEALWMGVPVITLAGDRHASRVGVSLLSNAGLAECIAHSNDAYVQAALALARDLPRLQRIRAGLRERMQRSPLMDAPRFARNLEAAYRGIWREYCAMLRSR